MAGYSGTPLPQKLGIKDGARLGLVRAPDDFTRTLGALPAGVVPRKLVAGKGAYDVIVCFTRTMAEVARDLPALKQRLDPAGGLWLTGPQPIGVMRGVVLALGWLIPLGAMYLNNRGIGLTPVIFAGLFALAVHDAVPDLKRRAWNLFPKRLRLAGTSQSPARSAALSPR